ncbi:MAG: hypothetical protein JWO30_4534 [Fibrobacteres bacterium]|nr:hypothetical protein [Fibrobacterota bacterium]
MDGVGSGEGGREALEQDAQGADKSRAGGQVSVHWP